MLSDVLVVIAVCLALGVLFYALMMFAGGYWVMQIIANLLKRR